MRPTNEPAGGVTYIGPRTFVTAMIGLCAVFGGLIFAAPKLIDALDPGPPSSVAGVPATFPEPGTAVPGIAVAPPQRVAPLTRVPRTAPHVTTEVAAPVTPKRMRVVNPVRPPVLASTPQRRGNVPRAHLVIGSADTHSVIIGPPPVSSAPANLAIAARTPAPHAVIRVSIPHAVIRVSIPHAVVSLSTPHPAAAVNAISRKPLSRAGAVSGGGAPVRTALPLLVPLKATATVPPGNGLAPHVNDAPLVVAPVQRPL
jgi:hypothetical protein